MRKNYTRRVSKLLSIQRPAMNSQSVSNAAIHQALVVMVIFTNGGSDDAEWGGITEALGCSLHSHASAIRFFRRRRGFEITGIDLHTHNSRPFTLVNNWSGTFFQMIPHCACLKGLTFCPRDCCCCSLFFWQMRRVSAVALVELVHL